MTHKFQSYFLFTPVIYSQQVLIVVASCFLFFSFQHFSSSLRFSFFYSRKTRLPLSQTLTMQLRSNIVWRKTNPWNCSHSSRGIGLRPRSRAYSVNLTRLSAILIAPHCRAMKTRTCLQSCTQKWIARTQESVIRTSSPARKTPSEKSVFKLF